MANHQDPKEGTSAVLKLKDQMPMHFALLIRVKNKFLSLRKELKKEMKYREMSDPEKFDVIVKHRSNTEAMSVNSIRKTRSHFYLIFALNNQKCKNCLTEQKEQFENHLKNCHDFACQDCQSDFFPDKRNLLLHKSSIHESKKYQCAICEMDFVQKSSLIIHLASDHERSALKCDFCTKQFSHKELLVKHLKKKHESRLKGHNLEEFDEFSKIWKESQCNACQKTFDSNLALAKHHQQIQKMTKIFPMHFVFEYTRKRKTMWDGLQKIAKFKCDKCKKAFSRKNSLDRHVAERNREIIYQCDQCEKKFYVKKGLEHHMFSKHFLAADDFDLDTELEDNAEDLDVNNDKVENDKNLDGENLDIVGPTMEEIKESWNNAKQEEQS